MSDLRVTFIQSTLYWEDIDANLAMFSERILWIKEQTDLIILPEMFATGFSMNAAQFAEEMNGKSVLWMRKTAMEKGCALTGSLMIRENDKFYNRLIFFSPDGTYKTYDKRHLFGLGAEDKTYTPGSEKLILDLKDWKICPMVCYDLRFPAWSRNTLHEGSARYDLLIYVANWPERRIEHWKTLLQARAIENQCYVVGVNRVGNDGNGIFYSGDSMAIDPGGEILSHSTQQENNPTLTFSLDTLALKQRQFPFLRDADNFELKVK